MTTVTRTVRAVLAAAALAGVMVAAACGASSDQAAPAAAAEAPAGLAGRWEGKTDLGGEVALDATVNGEVLTGMFRIDKQHESIRNGKIVNGTFTFNVALGGVANVFSGELKEGKLSIVRLSPDGPSAPLLLTRVK